MRTDPFYFHQILKGQDQTNDLLEKDLKLKRERLEFEKSEAAKTKKPAPPTQTAPTPKFNIASYKARMSELEKETDPYKLQEVQKLTKEMEADADRNANEITTYTHEQIKEVKERGNVLHEKWKDKYAERLKEELQKKRENQELIRISNIQNEKDNKERVRLKRINQLNQYIELLQIIAIEKGLLARITNLPTWPRKLKYYTAITSVLPLDTLIAAGITTALIRDTETTDANIEFTITVFITLWVIKLVLGLIISRLGRIAGNDKQERQIQNYCDQRKDAIRIGGMSPHWLDTSHNQHLAQTKKMPKDYKFCKINSMEEAQAELKKLKLK